jgi:ribosome biogenesis GTPase
MVNNHEEDYLPDYRKERKLQRKIASVTDRSKFKKTDQSRLHRIKKERIERTEKQEHLIRGRVTSIAPEAIIVDCDGGYMMNCSLRGVLKKERTRVKNLIVVGDFVLLEKQSENEGVVVHVEARKSVLSRADSLSQRKQHIIAANIDQVLITCSVVLPALKIPLIDRYIIAAQKGNMEPVIVVNKIDLLTDAVADECDLYRNLIQAYLNAGLKVISVSARTGFGLDELRQTMKGKASVFAGQSGTGKSSLINTITGLDFAVGSPVEKTRKGAHTTTKAHLVPLSFGGWCIDTPGIKSFGIWDIDKEEVRAYYDDIQEFSPHCKYSGCTHTHEPGCAVIAAVQEGKISPLRYYSYCALMDAIEGEDHLRR